jgi:SAM-dependent methyltransferase
MKSEHDILTEDELSSFQLRPRVLKLIDDCVARLGISHRQLRVLDWGCGRGRTVSKLLEMGIDAYRVDIDPGPIENGYSVLKGRGEEPEKRLICIDTDCRTPFADGLFHVIISDQVFEHVHDLEALAAELARIASISSVGLHNFPAKWRVTEPHLFIPFVHWLPKNWIRYWYPRLQLNRIPVWKGLEKRKHSGTSSGLF